jgi:hypothetical protein
LLTFESLVAESKLSQNSRLLDLIEAGLLEQAGSGAFPRLSESQLAVLRAVFHQASSTLEDEMLQGRSFSSTNITQSRKRRRPDSAPSITTDSTIEPSVPSTPPITGSRVVPPQEECANAPPLDMCDQLKSPLEFQQFDGGGVDLSALSADVGALWEFPDLFNFPDVGTCGYNHPYPAQKNKD